MDVLPPRTGELLGDSADRRVELLCDDDALHATWSRFGPGRDGADLHVHYRHSDLFYVLEGELTLRLGVEDRSVVAPAGSLVHVPPLVVHGFRNAGDTELRYVLEGTLCFGNTSAASAATADAGTWVKGAPETLACAGSEPVRLLQVHVS